jgi:hypothetical protein
MKVLRPDLWTTALMTFFRHFVIPPHNLMKQHEEDSMSMAKKVMATRPIARIWLQIWDPRDNRDFGLWMSLVRNLRASHSWLKKWASKLVHPYCLAGDEPVSLKVLCRASPHKVGLCCNKLPVCRCFPTSSIDFCEEKHQPMRAIGWTFTARYILHSCVTSNRNPGSLCQVERLERWGLCLMAAVTAVVRISGNLDCPPSTCPSCC